MRIFWPTLLACAISAHAQIYVSPTGDDSNPGTSAQQVRTLAHARDLARARKATEVILTGGLYRLSEPLRLGPEDSGVSYGTLKSGPAAIVSGGLRITGWKLVDAKRNLWSALAPAVLGNTRQLYIDGIRGTRARGRLPVELTKTETGYVASGDAMAKWRNASDIEFVYTGGNAIWSEPSAGLGSWTEPRCPVAAIDGTAITMAQPCWDNSTKRVMYADPAFNRTANLVGPASVGKQPVYVENAYELLGTPGQWYFDRAAHSIYYVPRGGEDLAKADVEAAMLESLVLGEGTREKPVHDIGFYGIQFSYATWLGPSGGEGFSEIQANYMVTGPRGWQKQGLCTLAPDGECPYGAWSKAPGNVNFSYARNITFADDAFLHLGGAGLNLDNGAQGNTVERCVFTDISGNGMELGNVNMPDASGASITADNRIANNHFYNVGAEFRGGIPIVVGYAQRTRVEHNQIDHVPYAAISMGWGGWPDKIKKPGVTNFSKQNIVANNLIYDLMLVLADGGGIYTQGITGKNLEEGEKVTGNVIHDQFASGHAIYTDNGSCNITVSGNVIFQTNFDNWGSRHADYYDGQDGKEYDPLSIENNYWQQGDKDGSTRNVTERGNHLIHSLSEAPAEIMQHAGIEPNARQVLQRQFEQPSPPEAPSRVAVAAMDGTAWVTWSPSVFEGGAPVESYTATASTGAHATIEAATFRTFGFLKVAGVENSKAVTFTVTARNANGVSAPSMPSMPVTPAVTMAQVGAPQRASANVSNGMASIHFQAPQQKRGETAPVLGYAVTVSPGGRKVIFTGRGEVGLDGTHTTFSVIDGLRPGETYTFSVAAITPLGDGPATVTAPVVAQ
jgi:Right handed beta helix region